VIAITLLTMAAEIAGGLWWHSMALLADGCTWAPMRGDRRDGAGLRTDTTLGR